MIFKIFIADQAFEYFERHLETLVLLSSLNCIALVFAYSLYIYYDFLGYNFMALGVSRIFGVELPTNFNSPYFKKNIIEFWNSWHITLSFWLRDYVFNPFGQFLLRKKFFRDRALLSSSLCYILTFTLCGAWHGFSVNYLIWGAYHGILLSSFKIIGSIEKKSGISGNKSYNFFFNRFGFIFTYLFVAIGWIFFMFDSPQITFKFFINLFSLSLTFEPHGISLLLRSFGLAVLFYYDDKRIKKTKLEDYFIQAAIAIIALKCILSLSNARMFLYGGF